MRYFSLPGISLFLVPLLSFGISATAQNTDFANKPGPIAGGNEIQLHNGWKISPAGTHQEKMGDMLLGGVISPNGKWLAVVNGGYAAHQVHLMDTATGKPVASAPLERAQSTGGTAFSSNGKKLYVSGANAGQVYVFSVSETGALTPQAPLIIRQLKSEIKRNADDPGQDAGRDPARQDAPEEAAFLGGLSVSPDGKTIYVANLAGDSFFALDADNGAVRRQCTFSKFDRPGAVAVSPDGKTVFVALWGNAAVLALDPVTLQVRDKYRIGSHPNALLLSKDGKRLYVSCGNADSVYVFNLTTGIMEEAINMRMTPHAPPGATPSALALSPDQKVLYVANSDNNNVAVVDVGVPGYSRVEGFIPTTWYPTIVAASLDGKKLFIGCGKGLGTGPNNAERPAKTAAGKPYIVSMLQGILSTVDVPDAAQLATYTRQVYANSPYNDALLNTPANAPAPGSNPIPVHQSDVSPIKHVLYIIKENRTYDQVFGDLKDKNGKPHGNGDPALTLFGEDVTPNHHALAREFVTLDNLYVNAEVSVDGHHWSNAAYVPDSMQRTWPAQYGGKGAPPIRYGDFGDPLAETPSGRIWDMCERAGLDYRTYYYHVDKRRSEEWYQAKKKGERDYQLADVYLDDLAKWEKTGKMPNFMVMALSEDHTKGTRPKAYTPQACVASNDLGLGEIVDAISHSRFWESTAIFVIEDDAQNGPDHVDAHRTVGLVISPYTRRGAVDSTFYSTCSMLRTMELILGLPPMSQYDAAATPFYNSFTSKPDLTPYVKRDPHIDLNAKNGQKAYGAKQSLAMDLSKIDDLTTTDEDVFNRVLWHSIKGANTPYPGTTRSAFFDFQGHPATPSPHKISDDDDDDD